MRLRLSRHIVPEMTPAEYAAHSRVCLKTVYRLLKAEKLKARKIGRQWRIRVRQGAGEPNHG